MTTPRYVACRCSHPKAAHDVQGLAPQCSAPACTCLSYRPSMPGMAPAAPSVHLVPAPAPARALTADATLAAGKASRSKRTVNLAEKITDLVEELARRLEEERAAEEREQQRQKQTDAARRRVTELEQELAAARAALRSAPRQTCPDCGATGLRNVGVHRAKAHGYQKGAVS